MSQSLLSLRAEAEQLMRDRRLPQAIRAFRQHLAREPGDLRALLELGICELLNGSEQAFLRIHDSAAEAIRAAGELPAAIRRLWRQYRALLAKVTATGLVLGSMATAAYGRDSGHRYSGGVYRPPRPEVVEPRPEPAQPAPSRPGPIDKRVSGQYAWGKWRYGIRILFAGTERERHSSVLEYAGGTLPKAEELDRIWTPWGVMQYFQRGGLESGWLACRAGGKPLDLTKGRMLPSPVKVIEAPPPVPKPGAKPEAKPKDERPAQPGTIDTRRSGRWKWDAWQYDYRVTNRGKETESRFGRLTCNGEPVEAPGSGDRVWTPWGVMQHFGQVGAARGWLPRGVKDAPLDLTKGRVLPSPEAQPPKPRPVSGHRYSGGVYRRL